MRLIRPLAEAKKHLKSWFLATFDILLMFQGLLSCLLLICSSKHIFWYQIYVCTTTPLRSRFMSQKVSNLVIFCYKIRHGCHFNAFFAPKACDKPLCFAINLFYTLWASFWYLIDACGCLRSPEIPKISHPMSKIGFQAKKDFNRVAIDHKILLQ